MLGLYGLHGFAQLWTVLPLDVQLLAGLQWPLQDCQWL